MEALQILRNLDSSKCIVTESFKLQAECEHLIGILDYRFTGLAESLWEKIQILHEQLYKNKYNIDASEEVSDNAYRYIAGLIESLTDIEDEMISDNIEIKAVWNEIQTHFNNIKKKYVRISFPKKS